MVILAYYSGKKENTRSETVFEQDAFFVSNSSRSIFPGNEVTGESPVVVLFWRFDYAFCRATRHI